MNNIDHIFRDGLAEHTTAPTAGMWERVSSAIPSATPHHAWYRWAAVMIPVLAAAGLWIGRPASEPVVAVKEIGPVQTPRVQPVEKESALASVATPSKRKAVHRAAAKKEVHVAPTQATLQPEIASMEEITLEPVVLEAETVVAVEEPVKPMTIEFILEPVVTENAAPKENALTRVVGFAQAVKHSDPIADIRGLKDELFALDLRKKQPKKN